MGVASSRAQTRLVGLDVARFLALLGMMATHLLATRDEAGDPTWVAEVFSGRASALFALLAGVSLALMTGGSRPVRGEERVARSAGLLVRALAVGVVGLLLGGIDSGVAVILVNYGVLMALGVLVVGCSARVLAALALLSALLTPVLLWWARPHLPPRGFDSPSLEGLEQPGRLVSEVLVTGYYPVLVWTAYLLAGMALGRVDLRAVRGRVLGGIALAGAVLAGAAEVVSDRLLAREGTVALLDRDLWRLAGRDDTEALERLHRLIDTGLYGQTPTDGAWQWLLVAAPHSSTTFDLLRTGGAAVVERDLRDIQKGFVQRERLDQFGHISVDGKHLACHGLVLRHVATNHREMGATFERLSHGHRGVNAELARRVVTGGDHTALLHTAANGNRDIG